MYLIFDTETTGLPRNYNAPLTDSDNWPRMVQIAWQMHDLTGELVEAKSFIIEPEGFTIPFNAEKIHGISTQMAIEQGFALEEVLKEFENSVDKCTHIAGHNIDFDLKIAGAEFLRKHKDNKLPAKIIVDTMIESTSYCALPGGRGGGFKYPGLSELHLKLFGESFNEAHNATADVEATTRCFLELIRIGVISHQALKVEKSIIDGFIARNPDPIQPAGIKVESNKKLSQASGSSETSGESDNSMPTVTETGLPTSFTHLHVHSYFSVLSATPSLESLIEKAEACGMSALALTDLGNLFGAFSFIELAKAKNIKPIIGCELYLVEDRKKNKFTKDYPDRRHQQLFLAKNLNGYRNLSKLSSIGWIEGNYAGFPRIDKEVLAQYKDDLITTTGGLSSEISDLILNVGETQAEEAFVWWKNMFGDDFYIQLNRHGLEEENRVNMVLRGFATKYGVKMIAAHDVFYIEKEDADLQDSLICIRDNEYQSTPKGHGKDKRFGFPNDEYYFKTQEEMTRLYTDVPEAVYNTQEVVDKIEEYSLQRDAMMPEFPIPEDFGTIDEYRKKFSDEELANEFEHFDKFGGYEKVLRIKLESDYLTHLTYETAARRYPEMTPQIKERIDFELRTIKQMGYPGYFLIVQDFLNHAREMGVWVGPGRGSAAGSVVAYCLKITNVDPLEYDLLFERFLNPDRISLPDIDIDFDEDGREKVLKWVVEKYGSGRVAHIITFGKMAPKMAIRDVARVKQLPLSEANRLAKLIPTKAGTSFKDAYQQVPDLTKEKQSPDPLIKTTLLNAEKIEGTVRNIGTHACGIIISKEELIEHIPLSVAKDTELLVTQFDGSNIEHAGMLKMDFLGLKTLSIIKDAVENIQKSKRVAIDIDNIPHDDKKTFELYSRGDTTGIFQFESDGMKKHLKSLKPNQFEDLIAMNALYRPGPMDYIPNYISRKHGKETIVYDLDVMEEYLKETFGITVYQEQVMRLSQKIAGFTRGEADTLRKAMGKKIRKKLDEMKPKFMEGANANGHDVKTAQKIWEDWEKFAEYAFNKSHSTCYAYVSYRMAYLKAHYPAEFMAAVLSRNLSDISKITFFIDETKRMGIRVLKPDVNESEQAFIVNKKGDIRFGMAAIKGLGSSVAESIIAERNQNGPFISIFDFARRINLRVVNKRSFEALAMAGAFDSFEDTHRAQFFHRENSDDSIFIEKLMRYAAKHQEQENSPQISLFGEAEHVVTADPPLPECKPWSKIEQLKNEKEVTGFYISGHPLDEFRIELKHFARQKISDFKEDLKKYNNRGITFVGMVVSAVHRLTKENKPWGTFTIEDFDDQYEIRLFSEDYLKYKNFLNEGFFLLISASVQKRFKEDELELRISDMMLLSDVLERKVQAVTLFISIDDLDFELVDKIDALAKKHPGNCRLSIVVHDQEEKISMKYKAEHLKVNPQLFLKMIEGLAQVSFTLN